MRTDAWIASAFLLLTASGLRAQSVLWHQTGPEPYSYTNTTLYPAWFDAGGDVNGDGVPDVVAAAPVAGSVDKQGLVFVYSGADGSVIHTIPGPVAGGGMGEATQLLGDLNGDGRSEIAASVFYGGVWIYSGADASLLQVIPPPSDVLCSRWYPLATIELDGDGIPDLVLGCPDASPDVILKGSVAVVSGADGTPIHVWLGDAQGDRLGWAAANAGDQDGDGVDDVIAGAPHFLDEAEPYLGVSYARLFSGASGAVITTLHHEKDVDPSDLSQRFGYSVAGNGSLDGEGPGELLASVHYGFTPVLVFEGGTFRGLFETLTEMTKSVRVLGDVDGDGFDDFVGSAYDPGFGNCVSLGFGSYTNCGRAIVHSGRDGRELLTLKPDDRHQIFGAYIAAPGDLDGDDFPDAVVSDEGWPPGEPKHKGRLTAFSLIPLGVEALGQGCAGLGEGVPRIGVTGSPVLGTTIELHLSKASAGVPAVLALGLSDADWDGTALPLDLAAAGLPGCSILVSPDVLVPAVTQPVPPAPGRTTAELAMPESPALVGLEFFAQWYAGGASPAFTRALRCELLQATP